MEKMSFKEERKLLSKSAEPTISIIMPFHPKISVITELQHKLKTVFQRVEKELVQNYPSEKVEAVLKRLNHVILNLKYDTFKKSIAIFVSEQTEKVFYLDVPVEEKIVIDSSFEIRDLIYNKMQEKKYLIFLLSGKLAKMFLHDHAGLKSVKLHVADNLNAYLRDMPSRVPHYDHTDAHKEINLEKYLHHLDEGLTLAVKIHPYPVFVSGTERVIGHFKKLTKNAHHIAGYIHGNYEDASVPEIEQMIRPHIADWINLKQKDLMKLVDEAMNKKKLVFGMRDVLDAASKKDGRLLVIEKDYAYPISSKKEKRTGETKELPAKIVHSGNVVNNVIEKVLENGGDVELVENGSLHEYQHIALVKYY